MAARPYVIRTDVQRVVYTRPATLPKAAPGAATGFDNGDVAYQRCPPVELATIVHYPDATGVSADPVTHRRADPQVVTISRYVPTISPEGVVRSYNLLADFVAAVLSPVGVSSLGALCGGGVDANGDALTAGPPYRAGSPYRWLSQSLAAQQAG